MVPYLAMWFMTVFPGKVRRLLSGKMTWKEPRDILGTLRLEKLTQIYRYCRQSLVATVWLGFPVLRG